MTWKNYLAYVPGSTSIKQTLRSGLAFASLKVVQAQDYVRQEFVSSNTDYDRLYGMEVADGYAAPDGKSGEDLAEAIITSCQDADLTNAASATLNKVLSVIEDCLNDGVNAYGCDTEVVRFVGNSGKADTALESCIEDSMQTYTEPDTDALSPTFWLALVGTIVGGAAICLGLCYCSYRMTQHRKEGNKSPEEDPTKYLQLEESFNGLRHH